MMQAALRVISMNAVAHMEICVRISLSVITSCLQVNTPVKARALTRIPAESLLQVTYDGEEAQTSTTAKAGNKIFYPSQDPQRLGARGDVTE
uniref:Uncharacterized protein n=1 Tax=Parascaris equorum TaxID=6256 RepID=A0A914S4L3_PAREQ